MLETSKGIIEFETYPDTAPQAVAHIVALVERNFYRGLRFHRVVEDFVIQIGDSDHARFHEAAVLGQLLQRESRGRVGAVGHAKACGRSGLAARTLATRARWTASSSSA